MQLGTFHLKTLSIVVPVFNEEDSLAHTHARLIQLHQDPRFNKLERLEIIYVDDGSKDRSGEILREFAQASREGVVVRCLNFSRNFGHSAAVVAGLEAASGEAIAIIDADLQDPPDLIPQMVEKLGEGWDVVYGQRLARLEESIPKRFTAWLFYRLLCMMAGIDIPKDTGDFRVITREVCGAVKQCKEHEPFLRGLMAWVGFRQVALPYVRVGRQYGVSKYPFRKMLRFAVTALVSFSLFPLRLALYFGVLGLAACFGLVAWAIVVRFYGHTVPGWTSLLVGFTFGQSVTLLVVGVIGLYTGRIHSQVQGRPRYILRE